MAAAASHASQPIVGLMLGDPTGIGPEVSAKLLAAPATRDTARVVVVGVEARRLGLSRRARDVRRPHRTPRFLLRDERDPGVLHVPRHFAHVAALRAGPDQAGPDRRRGAARAPDAAGMGKKPPRIGVAALNPHGGEGGMFGDEEITIIGPSVAKLNAEGIACDGPVPADTLFVKARDGRYDGVVMMYHDQGQIATRLIGFSKGITVTAGLPTVFTTSAHGTAFDIVGQYKADSGALTHALQAAARFAAGNRRAAMAASH